MEILSETKEDVEYKSFKLCLVLRKYQKFFFLIIDFTLENKKGILNGF